MREIDKIAEGLFEKIRDRFEDVSLGNDKAKATSDPERARFFNFDYVVNDHNHGNITMSLIDETSLKVYFSKNISKDLNEDERHQWYSFLRELREFARRNLLSFEPRDITRSTLKHRDIAQQSKADSTYDKDEVVAESRMYGTVNRSYESFGPVRIKLAHTKPIVDETHGARSRNIEAMFVENDQGERFRLPFNSLTGARAMARHVSAGGVPTDALGQHITEMVTEMMTLRPFIRGVQRRTFEDTVTKEMIESAFGYHGLLKNTLKKLKGKRGYTEYKETFKPALVEDEINVEELKELFVKKTLDERIEQALPLVHKAHKIMKENDNPFAQQFESWATTVAEGSWALPDTEDEVGQLIDLLSEPLPVGVDAQNATNALYNILGDDRLYDRLGELAEIDPNSDARDVVSSWLYDNLPHIYQQIESEIGDPDYPAEPAEAGDEDLQEAYTPPPVMINGKQVDLGSIELDGVESYDRPDYADAYAVAAEFTDGMALTDDELEELTDKHGDIINMRAHDMLESVASDMADEDQHVSSAGSTYGAAIPGGTENMLATTMEDEDQEDLLASTEAIQSAIIRRILNSIDDHSELLKKAGPEGIMNAASDVAGFHAPMEEIGSSDVSAMVREVYNEVGVDYPQEVAEDKTLEEAFQRVFNEGAINTGDIIRDKTQPTIQGEIVDDKDENYVIKVDDDYYHIKKLNAEVVIKSKTNLKEADSRFMAYLEPLIGQQVYIPAEGTMGTIVGPSPNANLPTGIQVKLSNGQIITTAPGLFKAERPGVLQQAIDKLNAVTGYVEKVPTAAKPYGRVPGPMDNLYKQDYSKVKEDILKLAGL